MENKPTIRDKDTFIGKRPAEVKSILGLWMPQIQNILHKAIDPNKFLQMITILITSNPQLQQCTIKSVVGALIQASLMGLDLSPQLGQIYILPFKNKGIYEATFMFGYRGLCTLMYRSGEVKSIYAEVVHEYDEFYFQMGDDPKIEHKWKMNSNRGEMIGVYAIAELKNGMKLRRLIDKDIVIKRHKNKSPAKNSDFSPWNQKENEALMWQKSAVKELFKTAPFSLEVQENFAADHAIINPESFDQQQRKLKLDGVNYAIEEASYSNGSTPQVDELKAKAAQKAKEAKAKKQKEPATENVNTETGEVLDTPESDEKTQFIEDWSQASDSERLNKFVPIKGTFNVELYCETNKLKKTKNISDLPPKHQAEIIWICQKAQAMESKKNEA